MIAKTRDTAIAAGVSIGLSLSQFILLADLLERLARLLPGMKGMAVMGLIIAAVLGELAFIYTRYHYYQKCDSRIELVNRVLRVSLVQIYVLIAFVPTRLVVLARAFGVPMSTDIVESGNATDTAIFCAALTACGICQGVLTLGLQAYGYPEKP